MATIRLDIKELKDRYRRWKRSQRAQRKKLPERGCVVAVFGARRRGGPLDKLRAMYGHRSQTLPACLQELPAEAREELIELRWAAFYYFIEIAELALRQREADPAVGRQLKSLGGAKARLGKRTWTEGELKLAQILGIKLETPTVHETPLLRKRTGRETRRKKINARIAILQRRQALRSPHAHPNWHLVLSRWHRAIVLGYELLPKRPPLMKRSPSDAKALCDWLSIPEIGLRCTRETTKDARRRFYSEPARHETSGPPPCCLPGHPLFVPEPHEHSQPSQVHSEPHVTKQKTYLVYTNAPRRALVAQAGPPRTTEALRTKECSPAPAQAAPMQQVQEEQLDASTDADHDAIEQMFDEYANYGKTYSEADRESFPSEDFEET